jgi:threonyl-tRNA synthetase
LGAIERTVAFLIEHFAGAFPAWLAPIQAVVIPISEHHKDFAQKVTDRLKALDLRVENWAEAESLQKRIRTAEKQRIPYMLIVGDKEVEAETVAVRKRGQIDLGTQSLADFETLLVDEVRNKKIT